MKFHPNNNMSCLRSYIYQLKIAVKSHYFSVFVYHKNTPASVKIYPKTTETLQYYSYQANIGEESH